MKYIVTVHGTLKDADTKLAQKAHDTTAKQAQPIGKSLGNATHHPYLNPENPREFFDVDEWDNLEGLKKFFSDPQMAVVFGQLFDGMPEIKVWSDEGWLRW